MTDYAWTDSEWSFQKLEQVTQEIEKIATYEMGLDPYPPQIEIITSEQMVDAYASIGLPIFYRHWSFGKHFTQNWNSYQKGMQGLAYEIVINSNPCISYLMEENTMTMQALVIAHACVSGDTEYLTPTGWKRIDQYSGDLVGQYHEDGKVTFVRPQKYIKREQRDFIYVESEKLSQVITDDHTVVFINQHGVLTKITGEELVRRQAEKTRGFDGKFITAFQIKHDQSIPLTDEEIRLHIAIKADGNIVNPDVDKNHFNAKPHYQIHFHLSKHRKIARLKELLHNLQITFVENLSYDGRVSIHFNYEKIDKRFTPEWYHASEYQLRLISEEICLWDGNLSGVNDSFSSAFKQDADFIQYAWSALGFHAHLSWQNRAYKVQKSLAKGISLSKHGRDGRISAQPFKRVSSEDGFAYCFTVDTGMLVIRHNNKISVTGNCFGHSHFFKHNHLFKEWTDAESIIDYLVFARDYIAKCEVAEGRDVVESFLDSCHTLMNYGINRYKRPGKLSIAKEKARQAERDNYKQAQVNEVFDTLVKQAKEEPNKVKLFPAQPEENILYFCEKFAPDLPEWKREIIRIVRKISEYFYPQGQTKVCNEGCATYVHYRIMNRLHEKGLMTDGSFEEFLISHTNVVFQPEFDDRRYSGINPYALGFAMMRDIERICNEPTDEDRRWFPDIAGCKDEMRVLRDAWANYRDESFIRQFLSPTVIRNMRLFSLADKKNEPFYTVTAIHDDRGYEKVRESLADSYERHAQVPQIEVIKVDPHTRTLTLRYSRYRDRTLGKTTTLVKHIQAVWGHTVNLRDEDDNLIA